MNQSNETARFTYNMSLIEMISAGKYDYVNNLFTTTDEFLIDGAGDVAMPRIHQFDYYISSKDAVLELSRKGLRTATLPEMLHFGALCPEAYKKYSVIALDDKRVFHRDGYRCVPVLRYGDRNRRLDLRQWVNKWGGRWLFLVVDK